MERHLRMTKLSTKMFRVNSILLDIRIQTARDGLQLQQQDPRLCLETLPLQSIRQMSAIHQLSVRHSTFLSLIEISQSLPTASSRRNSGQVWSRLLLPTTRTTGSAERDTTWSRLISSIPTAHSTRHVRRNIRA